MNPFNRSGNQKQNPCYNCDNRKVLCHVICEKHLLHEKRQKEKRKDIAKYKREYRLSK